MPTFYFNLIDESGTVIKDKHGVELADEPAARVHALEIGQRFLAKEVAADGLQLDVLAKLSVEVKDNANQVILTVPFSEFMTTPRAHRVGQGGAHQS